MEAIHAAIGNDVFWNDPDDGATSGPGKITEIKSDGDPIDDETIIVVSKDDGGEVETTLDELELLPDSLRSIIESRPDKTRAEFIKKSDLFAGFDDLHEEWRNSDPDFSWGDNDHTLVTISELLDDMDNNGVDVPGMFRYRCNRIGVQTFVDLEH